VIYDIYLSAQLLACCAREKTTEGEVANAKRVVAATSRPVRWSLARDW